MEVICTAISAGALVLVAIIETENKRRNKKEEKRRECRETESRLSMKLMSACVDLAYVTSLAVTGGHTNGNVEAAQEKAIKAQEEYEDFIEAEAAHAIAKV